MLKCPTLSTTPAWPPTHTPPEQVSHPHPAPIPTHHQPPLAVPLVNQLLGTQGGLVPRVLGKVVGPLCTSLPPHPLPTPAPRSSHQGLGDWFPKGAPAPAYQLSEVSEGHGPQGRRAELAPNQAPPSRSRGKLCAGEPAHEGGLGRGDRPGTRAPRGPLGARTCGFTGALRALKEQKPSPKGGCARGLALKTTLVSGDDGKRLGGLASVPCGGPP